MAKKHYTPTRSDNSGAKITAIIAVFLAIVIGAYVVLSLVFHSWNPVKWTETRQAQSGQNGDDVGNNGDEQNKDPVDKTGNDGNVIVTLVFEDGIVLSMKRISAAEYEENGIETQVESAYTIFARLTPDEPTDATVLWEVKWINGSSSWANGKNVNDYIGLSVGSDTHSARITCKKSFGEPVNIVAKAKSNSYATATCRVDYVKKATSVECYDINDGFSFVNGCCLDYNINYSDYTIDSETSFTVEAVYMNNSFMRNVYLPKLAAEEGYDCGGDVIQFFDDFGIENMGLLDFRFVDDQIWFDLETYSRVATGGDYYPFLDNCLAECIADGNEDVFSIDVKAKTVYKGEVVSIVTSTYTPHVEAYLFEIVPTLLDFNYGSLIF